jgi:hypothetical protein
MKTLVAALSLALLAIATPARADETFDAIARSATPLAGPEGLAALFWSQVADCKDEDDFFRRQCEGIKTARRERIAASTFLVGAPGAINLMPFDPKAMSVDVEVTACAACGGVKIAGDKRYLVGRGAVKVVGGRVTPVSLTRGTKTFSSKAEGEAWARTVAPRLTADLLVRLPAKLESWKDAGASGYHVEVVGFRVVDPCKGDVLWSQPKSTTHLAPDASACGAAAPKKKKPASPASK